MIAAEVADYRSLARKRVPRFLFDYVDGGAFSEATLARNRSGLDDICLRQRVMRDVSELSLATTLFDTPMTAPIVLGPVGVAGLLARRGEVQAARAARGAGIPFTLSTVGICTVDEVVKGVATPPWFQLYMTRDRRFADDLLSRAADAGCNVLMLTVDLALPGIRYRDVRSGLAGTSASRALRRNLQAMARPGWSWDVGLRGRPLTIGHLEPVLGSGTTIAAFWSWISANFDPSVHWDDIARIRDKWRGKLIVKGILDAHDAGRALAYGADGVVVSNHGGRQLDGTNSTARILPAVIEAIDKRIPVLVDGGVRTGTDVLRMLALGADAVVLGRAWAYGLAARGERGVSEVLDLIIRELRVAMALTGCASVAEAGAHLLGEAERLPS